jgi:hypothetical protein
MFQKQIDGKMDHDAQADRYYEPPGQALAELSQLLTGNASSVTANCMDFSDPYHNKWVRGHVGFLAENLKSVCLPIWGSCLHSAWFVGWCRRLQVQPQYFTKYICSHSACGKHKQELIPPLLRCVKVMGRLAMCPGVGYNT